MTIARLNFASFILLFTCVVCAQPPIPPRMTLEQLTARAEKFLPSNEQLRFQTIPWVHELAEAQKIAQTEKRPIFLWAYGGRGRPDNGLEGC